MRAGFNTGGGVGAAGAGVKILGYGVIGCAVGGKTLGAAVIGAGLKPPPIGVKLAPTGRGALPNPTVVASGALTENIRSP